MHEIKNLGLYCTKSVNKLKKKKPTSQVQKQVFVSFNEKKQNKRPNESWILKICVQCMYITLHTHHPFLHAHYLFLDFQVYPSLCLVVCTLFHVKWIHFTKNEIFVICTHFTRKKTGMCPQAQTGWPRSCRHEIPCVFPVFSLCCRNFPCVFFYLRTNRNSNKRNVTCSKLYYLFFIKTIHSLTKKPWIINRFFYHMFICIININSLFLFNMKALSTVYLLLH